MPGLYALDCSFSPGPSITQTSLTTRTPHPTCQVHSSTNAGAVDRCNDGPPALFQRRVCVLQASRINLRLAGPMALRAHIGGAQQGAKQRGTTAGCTRPVCAPAVGAHGLAWSLMIWARRCSRMRPGHAPSSLRIMAARKPVSMPAQKTSPRAHTTRHCTPSCCSSARTACACGGRGGRLACGGSHQQPGGAAHLGEARPHGLVERVARLWPRQLDYTNSRFPLHVRAHVWCVVGAAA